MSKSDLTLEQEFALKIYTKEINECESIDKLKQMLIELTRQSMARDNLFRQIISAQK